MKTQGPRKIRRRANRSLLHRQLHRLSDLLEREQISDYVQLLQRPWQMLMLNVLYGVARGLGIALGVTIFTTLVVWFLKWLGALDLPIIGDYLAELVTAVQEQMNNRSF